MVPRPEQFVRDVDRSKHEIVRIALNVKEEM